MKYSEPDEERQDLRLMIIQNTPAKQATDWLTAFHQVRCGTHSRLQEPFSLMFWIGLDCAVFYVPANTV